MEQKTYDRQTAKFLAVIGENMPVLTSDVMQSWIENPGAVQTALDRAFRPPRQFLRPAGELTLPKSTRSSSLQTRKGLWVSSEFDRLVGSGKATKLQETKIRSFDLIEPANDAEIQGELPKDHAFKATEIRGVLEALIGLQPDGEDGFLLTNGYWNLFYVVGADGGVCVVHVGWHAYDRRWVVDAGPLDDARWSEGRRVLSATA